MRRLSTALLVASAALFCACFPLSINPIYTDKDRVFVPQLLGRWSGEDSETIWAFSAHDPDSYRLELSGEEEETAVFTVHLARVEGTLLIDFLPGHPQKDEDEELEEMHLLRLHSFAVVEQLEPTLKMSFLRQDWLEKFLEENPQALGHMQRGDRLILTASTADVQKFVLKHLKTEGAFTDPEELMRMSDE